MFSFLFVSYLFSLPLAPHLRTVELRDTAAEHSASEKSCSGVMLLSRECTWDVFGLRRPFFIPGMKSGLPRPRPLPLPMLASLFSWQIDSVTISGTERLLLVQGEFCVTSCCWLLSSCRLPRPRRIFS